MDAMPWARGLVLTPTLFPWPQLSGYEVTYIVPKTFSSPQREVHGNS